MGGDSSKLKQQHRYSDIASDLIAYMDACQLDPFLQSFDSTLQKRFTGVIHTIAVDVGARSVSLGSLRKLTDCILKTNEQVVNFILENEKDMFNKEELFEFVKCYLENSLQDVNDCNTLDEYLNSHLMIQFDDEHRKCTWWEKEKFYSGTLKKLEDFKTAADPFTQGGLSSLLDKVYQRQSCMLKNVQAMKIRLDKKLNKTKAWKIVSNVIFGVTSASVLICSVVATALTSPLVVTALAAVAAAGSNLASMGGWINSLWKKYENEVEGQSKMKTSSKVYGTSIGKCDLDSIGVLVDELEIEVKSLLDTSDFYGEKEVAVMRTIDEIQEKLRVFEELRKHIYKCRGDIEMGYNKIMAIIRSRNKSTPWFLNI
ncbi:UPF0496 protein 1-like [Cornus florida]|uniref:UPF0496 protein 1-like n=1 Tax=Cornus florida TaxID=4283 RepID=UPI00289ADDE9|nr:UPF0496 protein 1-like [Cornus florida]XP_059623721.1 UPF0496 protein 1-like [Cornus florida]XP_059623722.1 UPF0496 protein 1-like [Cornus florida]